MSTPLRVVCLLLGVLACAGLLLPGGEPGHQGAWVGPAALCLALTSVVPGVRNLWSALRRRPLVCWSFLLIATTVALGAWIGYRQPVLGRALTRPNLALFAAVLVVVTVPFTYRLDPGERAVQRERLRCGVAPKALLAATTCSVLFYAVEGGLRLFFVHSDGFAVTAMHRAWMSLHWKPVNSLRFRDREAEADANAKRLLVVGDSFAAGHGVEDLEDTFARVLERRLGAPWRVNIAAKPGWSTNAELAALAKYPVRPNVVVLSYYINDMSYLLPKDDDDFRPPPKWLEWFANGFFSTSYLYWHTFQGGMSRVHEQYAHTRVAEYDDPELWARHAADLDRFVELARGMGAELVVLVWPRLDAVESSRVATAKVSAHFRERGVKVVDLTDELSKRPARELVVNRLDAHPNAATHDLAAERLFEVLRPRPASTSR